MPIIISDIKCPVGTNHEEIVSTALKSLGISPSEVLTAGIYKISLDARKREDIRLVCSVLIGLCNPARELKLASKRNCRVFVEEEPAVRKSTEKRPGKTVIAGFGPAGMFCALLLAENGYKPVVLERGGDVDSRVEAVNRLFCAGVLDEKSNVQFGEGGAGTFSDGKLTTRIGDPLCRYVLKNFRDFGAPEEILFRAKPHIGTDRLREVVKNIRKKIISLGGEVRFSEPLVDMNIAGGTVKSIVTPDGEIPAASVVLAIGHSARDTFGTLLDRGISMEPKPFSIGARVEHLQKDVDISLYGAPAGELGLPPGEYQLSHRLSDGRGVYTFCMCPGGEVVCGSSEAGGVVTNGMSRYLRDGENANAAVAVSVGPDDFPPGVLGGMELARSVERAAYKLTGDYRAPAMSVGDFLDGNNSPYSVRPTYLPGTVNADLNALFPGFISEALKIGIRKFSRQMTCFGDPGAVLTAPETRTSSPVRIMRNESGSAPTASNLYPCGEGAGYAGGIMSAAVDGLRTAMKIMGAYAPEEE